MISSLNCKNESLDSGIIKGLLVREERYGEMLYGERILMSRLGWFLVEVEGEGEGFSGDGDGMKALGGMRH